ncbi:MAG TPA: phosphatidate cytidylyltransferase, partial [Candidatus Nanopelagicaceae bacterium]|nr:phosphatidate cytidylyltransferase [Candidatus Nanopelagicaceae bacterium]
MPIATAIGLGLMALILVTLSFNRIFFALLVALVMIPSVVEFSRAITVAGAKVNPVFLSIASSVIVLSGWAKGFEGLIIATAISAPILLVVRLRKGFENFLADGSASLFTLLYLPVPAAFAVMLAHPSDGRARVMVFILAISLNDTGGYIFGVIFGKHPLAKLISPKKSWEGVAGSIILSTIGTSILFSIWFHKAWWHGAILAVVSILAGTCGDLIESAIK